MTPTTPGDRATIRPPLGLLSRAAARVLTRLYNLHWVADGVGRSSQPYLSHAGLLIDLHGIRTVVNLRGENATSPWYDNERAACLARGGTYLDLRMHSRRLPSREVLRDLLDALDEAPRPLLLKCSGGADRTGLACAAYLLHRGGHAALPQARRQLALFPYLHLPQRHQRWIRVFFDYYAETGEDVPFRRWVEERYSPEAFAAAMRARGQTDYWRE